MNEIATAPPDNVAVVEEVVPVVSPAPPWADWASIAVVDIEDPRALALAAGSAAGPSDLIIDDGRFYVRDVSQATLDAALAAGPVIDLIAYLKDLRWRRETSGVTVEISGEPVLVATARGDERATLHATLTAITLGLRADGATYNFVDGRPRAVSNADMQVAILAALSHVQATFDLEMALTGEIEVGSITTTAELDAAFSAA
ncbi:conserved hypothetical protein [Bosea sp. 62]|uniref:DUF4376 domain-containing protein n=1 Tax=unclassified Bosea (in: a-proteobacteria) TaxID=2653178 RepID=UPI00125985E3|nr:MULTISPECIES: DUF4376 domain-containing protein [unclassified Bosea (in: a-proteobacteria)]CAD5255633.1 conserved hypothetical protein [Bosea sp. 7B]CAD5275152.1 conserved hypothetical protein [Bosea sp. 21B]CAD5276275.1 conserved hypothetical protein [Bosea sp. 46]VVT60024.1 conserved hypothetical protein [Bosea sp. EC-HK365B]VXB52073.1 conserved hypothetical protein [Bosea sp. 62]